MHDTAPAVILVLIIYVLFSQTEGQCACMCILTYSFRPHPFLYTFFFGMSLSILYISKLSKNSKFYNIKTNFTYYFHLLFTIYQLNINRSHHFTHFSSSFTLLYTPYFFKNSVPKPKRIEALTSVSCCRSFFCPLSG